MSDEDYYLQQDQKFMRDKALATAVAGKPDAERILRFGEMALESARRIISETRASGVTAAIVEQLVCEMMAISLVHVEKRENLERGLEELRAIEAARRNVETTRVIEHEDKGRIKTFEKRLEIRQREAAHTDDENCVWLGEHAVKAKRGR